MEAQDDAVEDQLPQITLHLDHPSTIMHKHLRAMRAHFGRVAGDVLKIRCKLLVLLWLDFHSL